MRKLIIALLLVLPCLFAACKKDDKTPYDKNITGLLLRSLDAQPMQVIGTLDTKVSADDFEMAIYPTPSSYNMNVNVFINNQQKITLHARLVHVNFPDAPGAIAVPGAMEPTEIHVENEDNAGTVAMTLSKELEIAPPAPVPDTTGINPVGPYKGQQVQLNFDVTDLPQGFYRIYIETSDGRKYWDNGCVFR